MANFPYDSTVPAANHAPKNDQPTMQTNAASISGLIAVDHVGFNSGSTPGGYHKVVHFNNQGSDPGVVAGVGQLYTKTASADQQLFYESGNGVITQLTGPNAPSSNTNGYTWLPGNILLQWGIVNTTSSSGTVTFATSNISFPNNCFCIQTTAKYNSAVATPGNQANYAPDTHSVTNLSFNWTLVTSSGSWRGFYWVAIGN